MRYVTTYEQHSKKKCRHQSAAPSPYWPSGHPLPAPSSYRNGIDQGKLVNCLSQSFLLGYRDPALNQWVGHVGPQSLSNTHSQISNTEDLVPLWPNLGLQNGVLSPLFSFCPKRRFLYIIFLWFLNKRHFKFKPTFWVLLHDHHWCLHALAICRSLIYDTLICFEKNAYIRGQPVA